MTEKERLIQIFEHAINKAWGEGFDYIVVSPKDGKKILELLKEQEEQGWVSVNDRLPNKSGRYLVYKLNWMTMDVLDYSAKYRRFNAFDEMNEENAKKTAIDVTHWQSLPELPNEEN